MNNVELTINIVAVLAALAVMGVQAHMFFYLITRKALEWYDIYIVKGFSNALLVELGCCVSSESCSKARLEMVKQISSWERG